MNIVLPFGYKDALYAFLLQTALQHMGLVNALNRINIKCNASHLTRKEKTKKCHNICTTNENNLSSASSTLCC